PRLAQRDRLHGPNRTLGDRQAGQLLDDGEVHHDDAVSVDRWTAKKGSRKRLPFFLRFRILLLNLDADDARRAAAHPRIRVRANLELNDVAALERTDGHLKILGSVNVAL